MAEIDDRPDLLSQTMRQAPGRLDPHKLPPRFFEARRLICAGIDRACSAGIAGSAVAAVLVSEAVPTLAKVYGPQGAARILQIMAASLTMSGSDTPPPSPSQPEESHARTKSRRWKTSRHRTLGLSWSRKDDADESYPQQPQRNAGCSDCERYERSQYRRRPDPR
jgi:hypothetical protein